LDVKVIFNDDPSLRQLDVSKYQGIVISPGPGRPEHSGFLMEFLRLHHESVPVFGVCLGLQALGLHYGAVLTKAIRPMHGKLSIIRNTGEGLFSQMPSTFRVTRYHSLVLNETNDAFNVTAVTKSDNEIMALQHKDLPVSGVQFHPEAILTEYGQKIIENWVRQNKILN
jgi:anthranilate synthase component 2